MYFRLAVSWMNLDLEQPPKVKGHQVPVVEKAKYMSEPCDRPAIYWGVPSLMPKLGMS